MTPNDRADDIIDADEDHGNRWTWRDGLEREIANEEAQAADEIERENLRGIVAPDY